MSAVSPSSAPAVFEPSLMPVAGPEAAILIVDDDPSKRVALRSSLQPLGHRIVEAESGFEALRRVLVDDFAVILLDVQMPAMDGFETASLIRRRLQSEMTPIIFITAYSSDEIDQHDHYAGGAVDFIFAPIPPSELRSKVSFFAHVFIDAQRLALKAQAVQSSMDSLQLLTEATPIGIFHTDSDNRYVYTNPHWSDITGVAAEDAVGRDWDCIVEPERREELSAALTSGQGLEHRFHLNQPNPRPRMLMISSRRTPSSDGTPSGWVGTLADVTAETELQAALRAARDAAVSASNMQRSFAASASHELRTPIAAIIGYVEEILENAQLTEEDHGLLDIVYRNAQRLNLLIDDLMMLDQLEIGTSAARLEATALTPLLDRVITNLSADAQRSGIDLRADCGPGTAVMADPVRLEQALSNLISNALKFTPAGGTVTVAAKTGLPSRRRGDATGERATLSVADTGPGIDAGELDRIFERFYRTTTAIDEAVEGSGLGLAIAKAMIEEQGGRIHVSSTPGEGSTFIIDLPQAAAQLPAGL
jgi:PAS domain S-box-containing protein